MSKVNLELLLQGTVYLMFPPISCQCLSSIWSSETYTQWISQRDLGNIFLEYLYFDKSLHVPFELESEVLGDP